MATLVPPSTSIVKGLESDAIGLRRLTYGNGIEAVYQRSSEGNLARIVYRDPRLHASLEKRGVSLAMMPGVSPANASQTPGAALQAPPLPGALGLPADLAALVDHRYLWDLKGNLLHTQDRDGGSSFAYDAHDRLIAEARAPEARAKANFSRYYYDGNGNRLLAQEGVADQSDMRGNTVRTNYVHASDRWSDSGGASGQIAARYDAAGQPDTIDDRGFVWNALGKLVEVRKGQRVLARYRYNHRGERIEKLVDSVRTHYLYDNRRLVAELDSQGKITRQYVYLADQPIAVIDSQDDSVGGQVTPLARFTAEIGRIWRTLFGTADAIFYLHNNHLGAPEIATDTHGKPIWRVTYSPFGSLVRTQTKERLITAGASFNLNLRLPGQYADLETGLYYNDHRYYDAARGRYLTPDPIGIHGGINGYAYVDGNPLKYIDPSGLVLFAFDGTGNGATTGVTNSLSNVRKFFLAYDEVKNGKKNYITGIGTKDESMPVIGSMIDGTGFDDRVAPGFKFLDLVIDQAGKDGSASRAIDIDVVGYSRGAAEARVWVNKLVGKMTGTVYTSAAGNRRCLNLRFLGLWDTVSHLGTLSGDDDKYDFSIPSQVKFVAQAVALNEHRGGSGNFNARSIFNAAGAPNSATRNELGFVGSHSDIGGGYGTGDLSDAALMWIIKQGRQQGIAIDAALVSKSGWDVVANPILHDKSANQDLPNQAPHLGDREFVYGNGTRVKQGSAVIGGPTTKWAKSFVSYYPYVCGPGHSPAVGKVDMKKYSEWLGTQGIQVAYATPATGKLCN